MKKLKKLNQKLQKLQEQKNNFISIEDASITDFIKYRFISSEIKHIKENIERINFYAEATKLLYESKEKKLMENPKINCRKYCRLQAKAEYERDLKLYKLGVLDKKPPNILSSKIQAFSEKTKLSLQNIDYSKFSCFKKIYDKYNYFKSYFLPKQVHKLAINIAKLGIKGFRRLETDYIFLRNNIISNNTFRYIKNTVKQANAQVSDELRHNNRAFTPEELRYRESIKFNPYGNNTTPRIHNIVEKKQKKFEHTL